MGERAGLGRGGLGHAQAAATPDLTPMPPFSATALVGMEGLYLAGRAPGLGPVVPWGRGGRST